MKAIREGLEENLNVSKYANPTIHRFKMHFIKERLREEKENEQIRLEDNKLKIT